ncbi:MAG: RiPP maturation radical SAM C-methyltransferase [Colwellia sp.]|nr:RiPP maturation radical SAM C-methyltransferase [Colwellia sp.]
MPELAPDVCLINMPYSSITRPSLALGLIENYIAAYGYQVQGIYGNVEFSALLGLDQYDVIDNSFHEHLLGEWTFSRAAFSVSNSEDDEEAQQTNDENFFALFSDITEEVKQQLLSAREQAELYIEQLAAKILANPPKIVGCTSTFQQNCASLALLRKVKAANPDIITLMGGANCEGVMGQTLSEEFRWVDYVFSGECDDVIGDFIDKLMRGVPITAQNLPFGFISQKATLLVSDNKQVKQPPRGYIEDMSKVAAPIFDFYFSTIDELSLSPYINSGLIVETSRGCWWGAKKHCTFCGLNGVSMEHRVKSPASVIKEFDSLSSKYHITKFEVVDNILPMDYMKTVLPELSKKQAYNIFYETKSNLKKQHIEKLANAGIRWIQPGFESLNDDFLKLVAKGATAIQNISALKWCRNYGVRVSWNLLCGAPNEKGHWYNEMADIIPLIAHIQPPYKSLIKIRYVRFSPYFNKAASYGLTLEPLKSYQYIYPLAADKLTNIAYFFDEKSTKQTDVFSLENSFQYDMAEHKHLQKAVTLWSNTWETAIPLMYMSDQVSQIVIIDTRAVATNFTHTLTGIKADIYRLCGEPIAKGRLKDKLSNVQDRQIDDSRLDKALEELVNDKLIIALSNCFMSLALVGSTPPLPETKDYPAGYLDLDNY